MPTAIAGAAAVAMAAARQLRFAPDLQPIVVFAPWLFASCFHPPALSVPGYRALRIILLRFRLLRFRPCVVVPPVGFSHAFSSPI